MCWKSSRLNFVSIFQPSCKILFICFSVWNYNGTISSHYTSTASWRIAFFSPVAAVPPAGQCHHKNCSGTTRHALKSFTRPPNSPDPNSIGHARGSPVPTLHKTLSLVLDTTGRPPRDHVSIVGPPWIILYQPRPIDMQSDLSLGKFKARLTLFLALCHICQAAPEQFLWCSSMCFPAWGPWWAGLVCRGDLADGLCQMIFTGSRASQENTALTRWLVLFTSAVSGFKVVALYGCNSEMAHIWWFPQHTVYTVCFKIADLCFWLWCQHIFEPLQSFYRLQVSLIHS